MPVITEARNVRDILVKFSTRQIDHSTQGAEKSQSKRKPRIFPPRDPNRQSETQRRISGYTACGYGPNGNYISVPGFASADDALDYGRGKSWIGRAAVASRGAAVMLALALATTLFADRAVAQTAEQREVIARIAVDTVGVLKCGVPQKPDMFDGIERTGMRPDDVVNPDGKFAYVTTAVLSHAFARYNDHPAQFCAFIAGTRVR